jgi:hypothetical protein
MFAKLDWEFTILFELLVKRYLLVLLLDCILGGTTISIHPPHYILFQEKQTTRLDRPLTHSFQFSSHSLSG